MEQLIEKAKKVINKHLLGLILDIQSELYKIAKTRLYNEDDINEAVQETINVINNTENYYGSMMNTNFPDNERYYYKTDEKVRRVWVVIFNYEDNTNNKENEDKTEIEKLSERVNKGNIHIL